MYLLESFARKLSGTFTDPQGRNWDKYLYIDFVYFNS